MERKPTPQRETEWLISTNPPCSNEQFLAHRLLRNPVSSQRKIRCRIECAIFVLAFQKAWVTGGSDHGSVVGGKRAAGEENFQAITLGPGFKNGAQLAIRGDAAGNEN